MELSHAQLQQLRQLEEAQLREMILRAADGMGISSAKAQLLARHSKKLQAKLQKMSDAEINRFANLLGEAQFNALLSQMK